MNNVLAVKQLYFFEIVKFAVKSIREELAIEDTNNMFVTIDHTRNTRCTVHSNSVLSLTKNN